MDSRGFRDRLDDRLAKRTEELELLKGEGELQADHHKQRESAWEAAEKLSRETVGPSIRYIAEGLAEVLRSRHEPTCVSLPPRGWQCTVSSKGASFRIAVVVQPEIGKLRVAITGQACKSSLFTRGRAKTLFEDPLRVDLDDEAIEAKLLERLIDCATTCIEVAKK